MKKLYSLLVIILLSLSAFPQSYHPLIKTNKYWDVMLRDNSICGYAAGSRSFFDGSDTVINNQTYHIIKGYPVINLNPGPYCPPFAIDTTVSGTVSNHFIREDTVAQKVYVFETQNTNSEHLLYDFTLSVGDTLQSLYAGLGIKLVAVSVDTVVLFTGETRKVIYLDNGEHYIESIGGSKGGFFLPIMMGIGFDYLTECVMENGVELYWGICNQILSVNENYRFEKIRVFPNPSSGIFSIDVNKGGNINISVFNILGELIYFNQETDTSLMKIDLSKECSGIYFAKINSGDDFYTTKFVKH